MFLAHESTNGLRLRLKQAEISNLSNGSVLLISTTAKILEIQHFFLHSNWPWRGLMQQMP